MSDLILNERTGLDWEMFSFTGGLSLMLQNWSWDGVLNRTDGGLRITCLLIIKTLS